MRSNNDKVLCYLPSSSFPGKKLLNILSLPVAKIKIRPINGGGSLLIYKYFNTDNSMQLYR